MMRTPPDPERVLYLLPSTRSECGAMGWEGMKENELFFQFFSFIQAIHSKFSFPGLLYLLFRFYSQWKVRTERTSLYSSRSIDIHLLSIESHHINLDIYIAELDNNL